MERFAILIGVTDEKLKFNIKDVNDLQSTLERSCRFHKNNIKTIIDDGIETIDLGSKINELIEIFRTSFSINKDVIFLYFSGHGNLDENEDTRLVGLKSTVLLKDIVHNMRTLSPQKIILLIDSCHSGTKIFSKGSFEKSIRKYSNDTNIVYGVYASIKEEEAFQFEKLQNSVLTHFFINTISDSTLYKNGILGIESIAERTATDVYNYTSKFKGCKEQKVVREGRIEGVFPFAFQNNNQTTPQSVSDVKETAVTKNNVATINDFFDLEKQFQKVAKPFSNIVLCTIICQFYKVRYSPDYSENKDDIEEAIRYEYIDEDGDVNFRNRSVSNLTNILEEIKSFLCSDKIDEKFNDSFYEKYDVYPEEYRNQQFWVNVYGIKP